MLFIVQFEDDPTRLDVRQRDTPKHKAFLAQHTDEIVDSGAVRESPDADPVGSIWIVDLPTKAAVEAFCHQDPFWVGGLRKSMRIFYWAKSPKPAPVNA